MVSTPVESPFSLQSVVPSCQAVSCVPIHEKSLFLRRECKRSQDLLPFLPVIRRCPAPLLHFFHQKKEGSFSACESDSGSLPWSAAKDRDRCSPGQFSFQESLVAGGIKQKMLAYLWKIRSLGCCVVFWMTATFLMLQVL